MDRRVAAPIALVGIAGSGKTSVARQLARELGGECIELDAEVVNTSGRSVTDLFATEGESVFRRHEATALRRALERSAAVIDCGGGVVLDSRNRVLLREQCLTMWLEVAPAEAAKRMGSGAASRPLLSGGRPEEVLERQLSERAPHFESVAQGRFRTDGLSVSQVVEEIRRWLRIR